MSFREFTIEQIAGDMLPQHATNDQLAVSGFANRNAMTNMEGGVDPEEYHWYMYGGPRHA